MLRWGIQVCILLTIVVSFTSGQYPQQRLNIPGAVLVAQPKQNNQVLRQRLQQLDPAPPSRPRNRYPANAAPLREAVRPVVEEVEDDPQQRQSQFDEEVARLGITSFQVAQQQVEEEQDRQVAFRPVPVLRQDIRDNVGSRPPQLQPKLIPVVRQERPVIRQELKQEVYASRPPQPTRQEFREEPVQQVVRRPQPQQHHQQQQHQQQNQQQQTRQQVSQPSRPQARPAARPAPQYLDDEVNPRKRKPPVQILRKYRTDNADGSITWGYENEDGSFKEENIGIDCITRGKYGYVDPDGVKREYSYETGGTCEEPEEELEDLPKQKLAAKNAPGQNNKPYRLQQPQYIN